MTSSRKDKRWLKSVADPDLVSFFQDPQFDAGDYAKSFFEQREASHAAHRVEKLEGLKRQTESALRAEVVRNYQAFMHATEEIRTMEAGLQTLKDLLGSTAQTLQTFRGVHLVETVKPAEKTPTGRGGANARAAAGRGGGGTDGGDADDDGGEDIGDGPSTLRLKLPEWLDQAPIELEELLLERKHQEAAALIRRVREFSGNIQNATNLGRGVERIFQRVETMAAGMADRLMAEISAANTLTVWGFREHKSNFALLISLGHGEKAAIFFVGERSAMIRRSLRLVEVTADPLSYVGVLSETFFGQVLDAVTAFLKLFCKSPRIHERRSLKTGKSTAYYQVYQGVKDCGTAPFCRLVVWVNQQIDQYALLMGRQIRAVTMGPQRVTREQSNKKEKGSGGAEEAGFRLGPVASSLFSIVSLMLEEGFAAAAVLNTMGFPVGVQLASRLVPDVTHFLSAYVDSVKDNLVEAIRKDPFVSADCRLVRPEALCVGTPEEEDQEAKKVQLTSSARILVLELRDILDYALVLLEPPPPAPEAFSSPAGGVGALGSDDGEAPEAASYYTRDEFLELEPVIVVSLDKLLRTYLKETIACMRARRDELSSNQNVAVVNNLAEVGGSYIPLLAAWCAQLLPEIAEEEEVTNLRDLRSEFQRSAQNPLRAREIASSAGTATSGRLPSAGTGSLVAAGSAAAPAARSGRPSSSSGGAGTPPVAAASSSSSSSRKHSTGSAAAAGQRRESSSSSSGIKASGRTDTGGSSSAASGRGSAAAAAPGSSTTPPRHAAADTGRSSGGTSSSFAAAAATFGGRGGAGASRDKMPSLKQTLTNRPSFSKPSASLTSAGAAPVPAPMATGRISVSSYSGRSSTSAAAAAAAPPTSAAAAAEVAAARAAQAAAAATAASSGNVRSSYVTGSSGRTGAGDGDSGAPTGAQRRPTLTLKAAREAAQAKAKAAAEAKAAREAAKK